jgi:hypothetical protein
VPPVCAELFALVTPPVALVVPVLLVAVVDDPPTEAPLPPEPLLPEFELLQADTAARKNEPKTADFFIKIPRVSPAPLIPALVRDDHAP